MTLYFTKRRFHLFVHITYQRQALPLLKSQVAKRNLVWAEMMDVMKDGNMVAKMPTSLELPTTGRWSVRDIVRWEEPSLVFANESLELILEFAKCTETTIAEDLRFNSLCESINDLASIDVVESSSCVSTLTPCATQQALEQRTSTREQTKCHVRKEKKEPGAHREESYIFSHGGECELAWKKRISKVEEQRMRGNRSVDSYIHKERNHLMRRKGARDGCDSSCASPPLRDWGVLAHDHPGCALPWFLLTRKDNRSTTYRKRCRRVRTK